jgi:hypothetical protein
VTGRPRYFVAYATRPDFRLTVAEDVDGVLVSVPDVPVALQVALGAVLGDGGSSPAWAPDNPKNGVVSLIPIPGGLRVYYTGRRPGEPTGPFLLWRDEIAIRGVVP